VQCRVENKHINLLDCMQFYRSFTVIHNLYSPVRKYTGSSENKEKKTIGLQNDINRFPIVFSSPSSLIFSIETLFGHFHYITYLQHFILSIDFTNLVCRVFSCGLPICS